MHGTSPLIVDLRPLWDPSRLCANPDKGWYHHYYDNGTDKYPFRSDVDLEQFPGMDHLYVRLSWRHFEPHEGKFDWRWIDDLKDKWVGRGFRISVRITCKEMHETYATPEWVRLAGARGEMHVVEDLDIWVPDYGDPVFLEKLAQFHKAFAERYDHEPWIVYVDIGSIGTWGEGHEYPVGKQPSVDVIKRHLDLHKAHYTTALLVVSDDLAQFQRNESDEEQIRQAVEERGIAWRDDTPLVGYFIRTVPETFSVVRPDYFEQSYRKRPVVLECDHYPHVKQAGNWLGRNGSERGAEILRGAFRLMRPTYIGYHGHADEWLKDNPELAIELANWCGYWYFPETLTASNPLPSGTRQTIDIVWRNRGLAPAYHRYDTHLRLRGPSTCTLAVKNADNRLWQPDSAITESYELDLPADLSNGTYQLAVKLTDPKTGRTIHLGLKDSQVSEDGFHNLSTLEIIR